MLFKMLKQNLFRFIPFMYNNDQKWPYKPLKSCGVHTVGILKYV